MTEDKRITIDVSYLDPEVQEQFMRWNHNDGKINKHDFIKAMTDIVAVKKLEQKWKLTAIFTGILFVISCFVVFGLAFWANQLSKDSKVIGSALIDVSTGNIVSTASAKNQFNIFDTPILPSASLKTLESLYVNGAMGEYEFAVLGWWRMDNTSVTFYSYLGSQIIVSSTNVTLIQDSVSSVILVNSSKKRVPLGAVPGIALGGAQVAVSGVYY